MRTAVVTIVHGRDAHLRRQLDGLAGGTTVPDQHVVVAIDDPAVADIVAAAGSSAVVVPFDNAEGPLPIAAARNAGAAAAITAGAELLIFLDVDCIPGTSLVARYRTTAAHPNHRDALLCGAVTYLPPPGPRGYPTDLAPLTDPHAARPAPPPSDVITTDDRHLFWSLSFALTASTWERIGGFCTRYRGYGAEDTDFGQTAGALGVPMRWVGGADAFHQYHPVSDPPIEHVEDVVRNAAIFHDRWQWWPMQGWLDAFEDLGLITRCPDGRPVLAKQQVSGA